MREKKPINVRVGKNIQLAREERHLTQEALSEQIGVTPNHLSAIERGVSGVSLELLDKLCQALNVSADLLLFGRTAVDGSDVTLSAIMQEISKEVQAMTKSVLAIKQSMLEKEEQAKSDL